METLELVVRLVEASAWPAVALVIFAYLRKPLVNLTGLVETIRWEGVELDLRREFTDRKTKQKTTEEERERARTEPRAMVLEAWVEVAEAGASALKAKNVKVTERMKHSPKQLAGALAESGLLGPEDIETTLALGNIRNVAAHVRVFRLGEEPAIRYAHMAKDLVETLRGKK